MACSIPGCPGTTKGGARGLCGKHYARWRTHGDPLGGNTHAARYALRDFVAAAISSNTDACILWPFPPCAGYAYLNWSGKRRRAHIVVCEEVHGPKPSTSPMAAHSCGHKLCLNPRHLYWATGAENYADQVRHGTVARGENTRQAKLTEANVHEIRAALAAKETHRSIAARYGVSTSAISLIACGRNWAWVL